MPVQVNDGPLPRTTVAHVRAIARTATEHDGVAPLGEQALLDLSDPGAPVVHLTVGEPAEAYAWLDLRAHPTAELVVAPAARRRGLGGALLAAVQATAAQAAAAAAQVAPPDAPPDPEHGPVLVWAHGDLPAARALAARTGLTVQRELWQLARDLPPAQPVPPPPAVPDGVVVRPFVVGKDDDAWLAVNARAFAEHPEQGRMTAADLSARQHEPWFRADDLLLAEHDGRLLAFAWMKVEPGDDTGELYVIGVDPAAQGSGLGRFLTALTLDHLAARGLRRALLYTEATNAAAVRTYAAAGFRRSRTDVQYG